MKITDIKTIVVNGGMRNWVFVRVETDQPGLYGHGEATIEWKTRAVVGAVEDLKPLLIGQDPRNIEHCHKIMTKWSFWRLGVIGMTAVSGIDVALWDIAGKDLGVPVWRLLGGRVRDRVKVYTHLGMGTSSAVYGSLASSEIVERGRSVIEQGYRALKIVNIPYTHFTTTQRGVAEVGNATLALREAVGDEVDIMVDFHGRPASASAAMDYIRAIAPARPMFAEEPIQPGRPRAVADLARISPVPIACGERLSDPLEFADLFAERAVAIAQPDLCHCGGFTGGRRIAALAEAAGVGLAPHNPLGPLAGVAALHFAVATHNFVIQEEMSGTVPWFAELLDNPIKREDGHWQVPQRPGLGVDLVSDVASAHPFAQEPTDVLSEHAILSDGTVVDW